MSVYKAEDHLKMKPNCVYVIPPNKNLSLLRNKLFLLDFDEPRGLRSPIDFFFKSLAADRHQNSIGIVFSGMGSDGTNGLKAIKEANGIVAVQTPATAKFDSMPYSAQNAVNVDILAAPDEMPTKLLNFLQYSPLKERIETLDLNSASMLDKIIVLLRHYSPHDFSLYKKDNLFRRVERRRTSLHIDSIGNYFVYLQENRNEFENLYKEFLIGITSFFRDKQVWDKLQDTVLPKLLAQLPIGYKLRAWIPACSTGEEAYTLAIVFKEALKKISNYKNQSLQIFATDINNDAIDIARRGYYPSTIV